MTRVPRRGIIRVMRTLLSTLCLISFATHSSAADPADLIIHNAKVVTVDAKFSIAEAVAARNGRIVAVGTNDTILAHRGPNTTIIDAGGKTVLPGLIDSHVHPVGAASSEARAELPVLGSLAEVKEFLKKKTESTPEGQWIVIRYAFPTRLTDARFPTKAELDAVAPRHPVLFHAGPAGVANSLALKVSGVTKDTPNPSAGEVVKDAATGEPTGLLRNAYGVLKGVPGEGDALSANEKRAAVKKLFARYNAEGLTCVADRNASRADLDLYLSLQKAKELTVRVNVARSFSPTGDAAELSKKFDALPGPDGKGGPTGIGDEWVRIGPIKLFLDGGMLNGTAAMRDPWPKGDAYQVTTDDYRGLLFVQPNQLKAVVAEAAKRNWRVTAHCAGERGLEVLVDAYEAVNKEIPIRDRRFCITHANFPSKYNLERCQRLGVVADVQPAWLYKDGATLLKVLGPERMRWFQPYKTWLEYTTIGGGSDHMLRFDPFRSTNPWSPWLGIATAVTRKLERGGVHQPDEALTREQAVKLYTINNAYLAGEEKEKGSLEVGKLADLIVVDRDVLSCPADDLRGVKVLRTVVGGQTVFGRER
jgi:predicted amidohydrolase YtcJ